MSKLLRTILGSYPPKGPSMAPDAQFERLSANLRGDARTTEQASSVNPKKPAERGQLAHVASHSG